MAARVLCSTTSHFFTRFDFFQALMNVEAEWEHCSQAFLKTNQPCTSRHTCKHTHALSLSPSFLLLSSPLIIKPHMCLDSEFLFSFFKTSPHPWPWPITHFPVLTFLYAFWGISTHPSRTFVSITDSSLCSWMCSWHMEVHFT
jgi:hypothetical protein